MKSTAYLIQAVLVALWWLGLAANSSFYEAFQFPEISNRAFNAFLIPDVIAIVFLSLLRSYYKHRDLELIILGAFAYGSLYCLNASILSSGGFISTSLMILGLGYNLFLVYQSKLFRASKSNSIFLNTLKTGIQIICFWSISLVVFPWIIIDAFELKFTSQLSIEIAAYSLFTLSSLLGLSSAFAIITYGKGTPLPTDQTNALVTKGVYKYIRNPMAVAGMGQGMAVSLWFESYQILIYTFVGGLLWHLVVRPLEEKNMKDRFGNAYKTYYKKTGLWLPKFKL